MILIYYHNSKKYQMPITRDYGNELGCALSGAYILLKQFEEIYKTLPASEFYETKREILNIMFYFDNKLLPDIIKLRANFTDKVPIFEEQYHILESFGLIRSICDHTISHELTSSFKLLESAACVQVTGPVYESAACVQLTGPVVESTACVQVTGPVVESAACVQVTGPVVESAACVQVTGPVVESAACVQVTGPVVESAACVQENKSKRPFALIESNSNNPNVYKKCKEEGGQTVQFVAIKNSLGDYITEYNRIHPTIHHYLFGKKKELFDFCTKCRGVYDGKDLIVKIYPRFTLSISEIQEYYDNFEKRKALVRYIKSLMALREYENIVYIHINFKIIYGCMEIVIQKFRRQHRS